MASGRHFLKDLGHTTGFLIGVGIILRNGLKLRQSRLGGSEPDISIESQALICMALYCNY